MLSRCWLLDDHRKQLIPPARRVTTMEETAIPPLLGVIGHPIAGNPMQFAMERALNAANLEWRFLSFDVSPERLSEAVVGVDALGFRGLAIAPPHSTTLLDLVPQHSRTAEIAGWADAIRRGTDGSLIADHLLGDSLIELLASTSVAGANVALLGNTPESRALFATLITLAPKSLLLRDVPPADFDRALAEYESGQPNQSSEPNERDESSERGGPREAGETFGLPQVSKLDDRDEAALSEIQVLVRGGITSSTAAEAKSLEKQIGRLRDDCVVVDLGVCASTSPLLRTAGDRGLPTISAIDLLVARAAMAFRQWTGRQADRTALQEAFEEYLEI